MGSTEQEKRETNFRQHGERGQKKYSKKRGGKGKKKKETEALYPPKPSWEAEGGEMQGNRPAEIARIHSSQQ